MRSETWVDVRRSAPRIMIETTCLEVASDIERECLVRDVSSLGVKVERPYFSGPTCGYADDDTYLEIVIPEIDEIIVTRSEACFDQVVSAPGVGSFGLMRRTGYRIVAAASRDMNLLRDYVFERRRQLRAALGYAEELGFASCYARG